MADLQSMLQRVKSRKRQPLWRRAAWAIALKIWKLCRLLPFAEHVTVRLQVGPHRLKARLFSYDDLLAASPEYESVLARWVPEAGAVVVDAGAFIGRHALEYARAAGPRGQVIAVEPLRQNFRLLQANVAHNGYQNVRCVESALGAANGKALLRYARECSTATSDLRRAKAAGQNRTARVALRTLDSLLEELDVDRVDLVKIDVEGAELPVLLGAEQTLERNPDATLIIELHGAGATRCPVRQWLTEQGYAIEAVADGPRRFYVATQPTAGARRRRPELSNSR